MRVMDAAVVVEEVEVALVLVPRFLPPKEVLEVVAAAVVAEEEEVFREPWGMTLVTIDLLLNSIDVVMVK